jgi:hypothetical protein
MLTVPVDPHSPQSLRLKRKHTRAEFIRRFQTLTGREVKLRTLRAWESGQNAMPVWAVEGWRVALGLTAEEVVGLLGWAASHA